MAAIELRIEFEPPDNDHIAGTLHVWIKQARNLRPPHPGSQADPYVKLYLSRDGSDLKQTKQKSRHERSTLNPQFNEKFVLYLPAATPLDSSHRLQIALWDHAGKLGANEFLGGLSFSLQEIVDTKEIGGWFILFDQIEARRMNLTTKEPTDGPFDDEDGADSDEADTSLSSRFKGRLASLSLSFSRSSLSESRCSSEQNLPSATARSSFSFSPLVSRKRSITLSCTAESTSQADFAKFGLKSPPRKLSDVNELSEVEDSPAGSPTRLHVFQPTDASSPLRRLSEAENETEGGENDNTSPLAVSRLEREIETLKEAQRVFKEQKEQIRRSEALRRQELEQQIKRMQSRLDQFEKASQSRAEQEDTCERLQAQIQALEAQNRCLEQQVTDSVAQQRACELRAKSSEDEQVRLKAYLDRLLAVLMERDPEVLALVNKC